MIKKLKNNCLERSGKKPIVIDYFFKEDNQTKPIVIFCHGYKGFKDWGAWDLVAEAFAKAGYFFVKFNFSHNGGTVAQPIDFPDLEAFGHNNFSKELDDLEDVIQHITVNHPLHNQIDITKLSLIGHSRGGGIVLIKAAASKKVSNVISWAGVSDYGIRFPVGEALAAWKNDNVMYVENGRTKQKMPHYYQFYLDFKQNESKLTIKNAVQQIQVPILVLHGTLDLTVLATEAKDIHSWNKKSNLQLIENANHVFGASHPWLQEMLPEHLKITVAKTVTFLKKENSL